MALVVEVIRELSLLLLLSLLAALAGFVLASSTSSDARGCRAADGHWQVIERSCQW